jgi:hypothetical protein
MLGIKPALGFTLSEHWEWGTTTLLHYFKCMHLVRENSQKLRQKRKWALWMRHLAFKLKIVQRQFSLDPVSWQDPPLSNQFFDLEYQQISLSEQPWKCSFIRVYFFHQLLDMCTVKGFVNSCFRLRNFWQVPLLNMSWWFWSRQSEKLA